MMRNRKKALGLAIVHFLTVAVSVPLILAGTAETADAALAMEFMPYSNLAHFNFEGLTNDDIARVGTPEAETALFTYEFTLDPTEESTVSFIEEIGPGGQATTVMHVLGVGNARVRINGSANQDYVPGSNSNVPRTGDTVTGHFYFKSPNNTPVGDWLLPRINLFRNPTPGMGGGNFQYWTYALTAGRDHNTVRTGAASYLGGSLNPADWWPVSHTGPERWTLRYAPNAGNFFRRALFMPIFDVLPEDGGTNNFHLSISSGYGAAGEFFISEIVFGTERQVVLPPYNAGPVVEPFDINGHFDEGTGFTPAFDPWGGFIQDEGNADATTVGAWESAGYHAGTPPTGAPGSGSGVIRIDRPQRWGMFHRVENVTLQDGDFVGGHFWLWVPYDADLTRPNAIPGVQFGQYNIIATSEFFPLETLVRGEWNKIPILPTRAYSSEFERPGGATAGGPDTGPIILGPRTGVHWSAPEMEPYTSPFFVDGITLGVIRPGIIWHPNTEVSLDAVNGLTADLVIQNAAVTESISAFVILALFCEEGANSSLVDVESRPITIIASDAGISGYSVTALNIEDAFSEVSDFGNKSVRVFIFDNFDNMNPIISEILSAVEE